MSIEIVSRLETELSGLNGVEDINSRSDTGRARVTLTYSVGTDMGKALTMLLSELSGITDLHSLCPVCADFQFR